MPLDESGVLVVWALLVWRCARRTSISDVSHTELAKQVGVGRDTVLRWLQRAETLGWLSIRRGHRTCTYAPQKRPRKQDGRRYVELEPAVLAALVTGRIHAADLRTLVRFLREIRGSQPWADPRGYTTRSLAELSKTWGTHRDDLGASRRRLAAAGLLDTRDVPGVSAVTAPPGRLPAGADLPPKSHSTCPPNPTTPAPQIPQQTPRSRRSEAVLGRPYPDVPLHTLNGVTSQPKVAEGNARAGAAGTPAGTPTPTPGPHPTRSTTGTPDHKPGPRPDRSKTVPTPRRATRRPARVMLTDRARAADVRTVIQALPGWLRHRLSETDITRLAAGVPAQLEERTVAQLLARIHRRAIPAWHDDLRDPAAFAFRVLQAPRCPDPRCEDGTTIDTGAPCPLDACPGPHWLGTGPQRLTDASQRPTAPHQPPTTPRPPTTPKPAPIPPWCGHCDPHGAHQPTARWVEDPHTGALHRCPDCHPHTATVAA